MRPVEAPVEVRAVRRAAGKRIGGHLPREHQYQTPEPDREDEQYGPAGEAQETPERCCHGFLLQSRRWLIDLLDARIIQGGEQDSRLH